MNDKVTTIINGITYTCSAATVLNAAWSANEVALIGGLALGFCTFVYNVWNKERIAKILKEKTTADVLEEAEK